MALQSQTAALDLSLEVSNFMEDSLKENYWSYLYFSKLSKWSQDLCRQGEVKGLQWAGGLPVGRAGITSLSSTALCGVQQCPSGQETARGHWVSSAGWVLLHHLPFHTWFLFVGGAWTFFSDETRRWSASTLHPPTTLAKFFTVHSAKNLLCWNRQCPTPNLNNWGLLQTYTCSTWAWKNTAACSACFCVPANDLIFCQCSKSENLPVVHPNWCSPDSSTCSHS